MKKKRIIIWIIAVLFLIILPVVIYFNFFFYYTCDDYSCFQAHQKNCDKTIFRNNLEDATWQYKILGKSETDCKIDVTLLDIKTGTIQLGTLKGKSMTCFLPLNSIIKPESDVSRCHGLLKEELQQLMINKLHSYIVSNLGAISEELGKVI